MAIEVILCNNLNNLEKFLFFKEINKNNRESKKRKSTNQRK